MATPPNQFEDDSVSYVPIRKTWVQSLTGFKLKEAYNIFHFDSIAHMKSLGLRPVQVRVLSVVQENTGIRQGEVAIALNIARENLTPLMNRLEEDELLIRKRDPVDRRAFCVELTEHGENVLEESKVAINQHEKEVLANLSSEEEKMLSELLDKLSGRI